MQARPLPAAPHGALVPAPAQPRLGVLVAGQGTQLEALRPWAFSPPLWTHRGLRGCVGSWRAPAGLTSAPRVRKPVLRFPDELGIQLDVAASGDAVALLGPGWGRAGSWPLPLLTTGSQPFVTAAHLGGWPPCVHGPSGHCKAPALLYTSVYPQNSPRWHQYPRFIDVHIEARTVLGGNVPWGLLGPDSEGGSMAISPRSPRGRCLPP